MLRMESHSPVGPDELLRTLVGQLSPDERIWKELRTTHRIHVRIAIHMTGWNRGFELLPDSLVALALMGGSFGVDIYAYGDDPAA